MKFSTALSMVLSMVSERQAKYGKSSTHRTSRGRHRSMTAAQQKREATKRKNKRKHK